PRNSHLALWLTTTAEQERHQGHANDPDGGRLRNRIDAVDRVSRVVIHRNYRSKTKSSKGLDSNSVVVRAPTKNRGCVVSEHVDLRRCIRNDCCADPIPVSLGQAVNLDTAEVDKTCESRRVRPDKVSTVLFASDQQPVDPCSGGNEVLNYSPTERWITWKHLHDAELSVRRNV